jgi:S1-C subfamily serine protease
VVNPSAACKLKGLNVTSAFRFLCIAILTIVPAGLASAQEQEQRNAMDSEISARVLASVVRIELRKKMTDALGVCVTDDGYVLFRSTSDLRVRTPLPNDKLTVRFESGDRFDAQVISSSNEWGVTLAKIESDEKQPSIPLQNIEIAVGDACYAVDRQRKSDEITIVSGAVTRLNTRWSGADLQVEGFPPVFSASGKLIGITTNKSGHENCVQTRSGTILDIWEDLKAGGNIDQERSKRIESKISKPIEPRTIALATTVRIRPIVEPNDSWSGVVVKNGVVVTIGHHQRLPGTKVSFHFDNGDVARGELMGFNPITDIGLARITDGRDWPAALLGTTEGLKLDTDLTIAGFPADLTDRRPVIYDTKVAEPDQHVWSNVMYTDADGFETRAGMSGSGVFNKNGRLIGLHIGKNWRQPSRFVRAEFLQLQWNDLRDGKVETLKEK